MKRFSVISKLFLVLFLLNLLCSISAKETKWMIYPSLGFDMGGAIPWPLSNLPDDYKGTPKVLPSVGLGFGYQFKEKWELDVELNYHNLSFTANAYVVSQEFFIPPTTLYYTGSTKTDAEIRFLEVPVVFNYQLKKNWQLSFGPYFSYILEGSFLSQGVSGWQSINKDDTDNPTGDPSPGPPMDFTPFLDNYDLGLFIGYKYKVFNKLYFWGRFHAGFKSLFVKEFDNLNYEMYQLRLSFGLSYKLFPGNGTNTDD